MLFAANTASAHGWMRNATPEEMAQRHQEMFQEQAALLGTTEEVVKNAWAEGKNLRDLAQQLGISDTDLQTKMQAARQAELKQNLQSLVDKGVITQAQADKRLAATQQRISQGQKGRGPHGMFGRHGWGL